MWRIGGMLRVALIGTGGACVIAGVVGTTACEREQREFQQSPPSTAAPLVRVSKLQPGPVLITDSTVGPYGDNAYEMSQGKQLFSKMNCVGCHSHGGGGMGPALMDDTWTYGSDPAQIFATIVQGRPNGMPAFRGKLSNDQVWQLVAYVRSLSGIGRRDVRGGRDDAMYGRSSEQNTKTRPPRTSTPSSASQAP
jgi:cytochrome c oxidase cbb3-type subunit III